MTAPLVCVFDYGFGNVRSATRALEHVGARVELTSDRVFESTTPTSRTLLLAASAA